MMSTYIIAEAGVNHNGSQVRALEMIVKAKKMGADAVKFQLFHADKLTTFQAQQAHYQKNAYAQQKTQHEMLKELELSYDDFYYLKQKADEEKIDFIVTPFDIESLMFITQTLMLPIVKIGSGDITNGPLLLAAGQSNKNVILSTGMSTLAEVEMALKVLAYGFLQNELPTQARLNENWIVSQKHLNEKVTLLHCTSEYPAPIEEVNLRAIDALAKVFGLKVGLSDHTLGNCAALAAVARGACMIEKHFTLDNALPGPDHRASLDVCAFSELIKGIRNVEKALGDGKKHPSPSEKKNINLVRRALVAEKKVKKGEIFSKENIAIKRPFHGLSPMHYWDLLGKKAQKDYEKDEGIMC